MAKKLPHQTTGIYIGPNAKNNSIGTVISEGFDIAMEDHGLSTEVGTGLFKTKKIGLALYGEGFLGKDLTFVLIEPLPPTDVFEAAAQQAASELPDDAALFRAVAQEAQKGGHDNGSLLSAVEQSTPYRTAQVAGAIQTVMEIAKGLYDAAAS